MSEAKICRKCEKEIPRDAAYCTHCGTRQDTHLPPLSLKFILSVCVLGIGIWGFAWATQQQLAGDKPTRTFENKNNTKVAHAADVEFEGALKQLKSEADEEPQNKKLWWAYTEGLISAARANPNNNAKYLFALLDALRRIIDIDPNDKKALLALAEISFERKAFGKAVEVYSRFLELEPDNLDIRARYASSLTFIGEFKKAITELVEILEKEPDHFQANAYLAIAYSQEGKLEEALKQGEHAISVAPNEEAKERLRRFLDSLKEEEGLVPTSELPSGLQSEVDSVSEYIKTNPVAGKRFVDSKSLGKGVLQLRFKNFPMKLMPDFAKKKFLGDLENFLKAKNFKEVKQIEFVDLPTGEVMETVKQGKR